MPFRVLLAWALVLGATSLASAQRVVVERFGGAQSARLRGLLIQSLEENGVEIVPEDEYRAALREAAEERKHVERRVAPAGDAIAMADAGVLVA